jgi:hypothetical protein
MQHDITKKCADSLRIFAQNNYGIKLKSTHAHELVAAYFGYSSRAALLADTKCPITNIKQAELLVLTPTALITERREQLDGLSENLPHDLAEGVYLPLYDESDKWIQTQVWPSFDFLARFLIDEAMIPKPNFYSSQRIQREGIKTENIDGNVCLKVFREYVSPHRLLYGLDGTRGVIYIIELTRVAGHIGYSNATISIVEAATLDLAVEQLKFKTRHIEKREPLESDLAFNDWLKKPVSNDSMLDYLAADIARGNSWLNHTPLDEYKAYLRSNSGDSEASETLDNAWKTYKTFLKGTSIFANKI